MNTTLKNIQAAETKTNEKVNQIAKLFSIKLSNDTYIPKFTESSSNEWVSAGKNNKWFYELIELANESALHGAILKSIIYQVRGKGLRIKNRIKDEKLNQFLLKCNSKMESLYDVSEKLIYDFAMFGGFCTSNIWTKGKQSFEIYHTDFSTIRSGKAHETTGLVSKYFFSSDWTKGSQTKVTAYPAFDTKNRTATQISYFVPYTSGLKYYPLPLYQAVIGWAKLDSKVCEFHNANIDNSFFPNLFLNYCNGIPDPVRADEIYQDLIEQFAGGSKAGRLLVNFSESKATSPEVTILNNNDNDEKFTEISKLILAQIIAGYRVPSPELVGIATPGQLGVSDTGIAQELFTSIVITPLQQAVEKELNKLLRANGFENEIEIIPVQPLSYTMAKMNEQIFSFLTINEIRELVGKEPIEGYDIIAGITAKEAKEEKKPKNEEPKTPNENEPDTSDQSSVR